jgi:hypothetical protein
MQPDELKGRRCREEAKNTMAKSPKSRCCKVKGLPGGGLFDIVVYPFFRPHRVAIYVLRTTRLLADYGIIYLHLKNKNY